MITDRGIVFRPGLQVQAERVLDRKAQVQAERVLDCKALVQAERCLPSSVTIVTMTPIPTSNNTGSGSRISVADGAVSGLISKSSEL